MKTFNSSLLTFNWMKGGFMTKITSRSKQAEKTKNKIYKNGVKLIIKRGYDNITVEQISKAAGVSVGTYYYYFKSKFELIREIYKKGDEYFLQEVAGKLISSTCKGQLLEFFDRYATFNIDNGIDMVKNLYNSENKMFITDGRAMQQVLQDIIDCWRPNGYFIKEQSSIELCRILFIAARGVIYNWCLYDGTLDLNKEMNIVISAMVDGIMKQ